MGAALSSALQVADTADPENLRWFLAPETQEGSQKGATTPAASVSIETKSSIKAWSKHPVHYYKDGDVAFIVEDYVFRLHRSVLEAQSNAMKDLYSIGEVHGRADKVFDDVIAVGLNDSAKDFANVLDIVYDRRSSQPNQQPLSAPEAPALHLPSKELPALGLNEIVGVVRVSWKYELEDIANAAISQLEQELPLANANDIPKLEIYKNESGLALAANVVNLARECQLPQFGPMALYALATSEWNGNDFQGLSSVFPILSAQMHLRLNAGRVRLQKAVMQDILKPQEPCASCSLTQGIDSTSAILHPLETIGDAGEGTRTVHERVSACSDCSTQKNHVKETMLKDWLNQLPGFFRLD
ncbi:hypothetical protein FRB90_001983 [Tulasnella sp. 427]|nr:hypothetical protein FRB90_001983 [Tulasnella sp. 427]